MCQDIASETDRGRGAGEAARHGRTAENSSISGGVGPGKVVAAARQAGRSGQLEDILESGVAAETLSRAAAVGAALGNLGRGTGYEFARVQRDGPDDGVVADEVGEDGAQVGDIFGDDVVEGQVVYALEGDGADADEAGDAGEVGVGIFEAGSGEACGEEGVAVVGTGLPAGHEVGERTHVAGPEAELRHPRSIRTAQKPLNRQPSVVLVPVRRILFVRQHREGRIEQPINSRGREVLDDDHLAPHLAQQRVLRSGHPNHVQKVVVVLQEGALEGAGVGGGGALGDDVHEDGFERVGLEEGADSGEHAGQISVEGGDAVVDLELVLVVAAADVQRPHAHHHLVRQSVALGLEGVAPCARAHRRVRPNDGQLAQGDAAVQLAHPVGATEGRALVAVELQRQRQQRAHGQPQQSY